MNKSSKQTDTMLPLKPNTIRSIFSAFTLIQIAEELKSPVKQWLNLEDPLSISAEFSNLWKEFINGLAKGKRNKDTIIKELKGQTTYFDQLNKILKEFILKVNSEKFELKMALPEEFLFSAGALIQRGYYEIMNKGINEKSDIENWLDFIETGHHVFFRIIGQKGHAILSEKCLMILQDTIKTVLNNMQFHLKLAVTTEKSMIIKKVFEKLLFTIIIVTVFSENEHLSEAKYRSLLEYVKIMLTLILQNQDLAKIFNEPCNFIDEKYYVSKIADTTKICNFINKIIISTSNNYSILSYGQYKNTAEKPLLTLRYLLFYYQYKLQKLLIVRKQIYYDEHIFSVFSKLAKNAKSGLSFYELMDKISEKQAIFGLLNESTLILKTYILSAAYFSENALPMDKVEKYEFIKEYANVAILCAIKSNTQTQIFDNFLLNPNDFTALIFKSLLFAKKIIKQKSDSKFPLEIIQSLNSLLSELMPKTISIDNISLNFYRLYLVQFLNEFEPEEIKEKYIKYAEETNKYLNNCNLEENDNELMKLLKTKIRENCVNLFIKFSQIDCELPVAIIIINLKENLTDYIKLQNLYGIIMSLLCKKIISPENMKTLENLTNGNPENLLKIKDTIGAELINSEICKKFIEKDGISVIFKIYKNALTNYETISEQFKNYKEKQQENFHLEDHLKEYECKINLCKKLVESTGDLIILLHNFQQAVLNYLNNTGLDHEFYQISLSTVKGQRLIIRILKTISFQIYNGMQKELYIKKLAAIILEIMVTLKAAKTENEKILLIEIAEIIKILIENSVFS